MATAVDLKGTNVVPITLLDRAADKREISIAVRKLIEAAQELQTIVDGLSPVPNIATGTVQFAASTTSTVINDTAIGVNSVIGLMPLEAAAVSQDSWWYFDAPTAGSVTVRHSSMTVTRDFRYLVAG